MRIETTRKGRRFAISDIHGCLKTFHALLEKINLKKEDDLFLLGDFIDRGAHSKGVIDYVRGLEDEGFRLHCLRGNHEEMMIKSRVNAGERAMWLRHGGLETIDSFPDRRVPQEYFYWMMSLPHYFETDDYLLVHAGFDFTKEEPFEDISAMLWIRKWYQNLDKKKAGGRVIIHGHTPTPRPVLEKRLQNLVEQPIVNIDCGCYYDKAGLGYLCAFDMDKKSYIFQENIEN